MLVKSAFPLRYREIVKISHSKEIAEIRDYLSAINTNAYYTLNPNDSSIVIVDFASQEARDAFSKRFGCLSKKPNFSIAA